MFANFFKSKPENKQDTIQEAIDALNQLTKHFQEYEQNNNNSNITIELAPAWYKCVLLGGDTAGIQGTLVMKSSLQRYGVLEDHPLKKTLKEIGFRVGANSSSHSKNSVELKETFFLYDAKLISQVPERCQRAMNESQNKLVN